MTIWTSRHGPSVRDLRSGYLTLSTNFDSIDEDGQLVVCTESKRGTRSPRPARSVASAGHNQFTFINDPWNGFMANMTCEPGNGRYRFRDGPWPLCVEYELTSHHDGYNGSEFRDAPDKYPGTWACCADCPPEHVDHWVCRDIKAVEVDPTASAFEMTCFRCSDLPIFRFPGWAGRWPTGSSSPGGHIALIFIIRDRTWRPTGLPDRPIDTGLEVSGNDPGESDPLVKGATVLFA